MIVEEEAYLEHYGVKGMKWGQRMGTAVRNSRAGQRESRAERKEKRYTNPDGTPMTDRQRKAVDRKRTAKINKAVSYGYLAVIGTGLVVSMMATDTAHMKASTAGASAKAVKGKGFASNLPKKTLKQVEIERNTRFQNAQWINKMISESKRLDP